MSENQEPKLEGTESKQVIVLVGGAGHNALAQIAGDLFNGIDFTGLNGAIDAIAGKAGELDKEEKEAARQIVGEWESMIIKRLGDKHAEMLQFVDFFTVRKAHGVNYRFDMDKLEGVGQDIADRTGTIAEYNELLLAIEALEKFQQTRPEKPVRDDEVDSQLDFITKDKDYQKELAIYEIKVNRYSRDAWLKENAWKELVNQNAEVKDLIKRAKNYGRNVSSFQTEAKEKSRLARLNITIASEAVRNSLREMLTFSRTI